MKRTCTQGLRIRIRIQLDPVFLNGSGSVSGFQNSLDPDPVPASGSRIKILGKKQRRMDPSGFFPGSGSDQEKIMDLDPVCQDRLDPDPKP